MEKPQEAKKLAMLKTDTLFFKNFTSRRSFSEQLNLERERNSIERSSKETNGKLNRSLKFTSEEDSAKWNGLREKLGLIVNASDTLTEEILNSPLKETIHAISVAFILDLAKTLIIKGTVEKMEKLAVRNKFLEHYMPFKKIHLFALCSEVLIKICGITTSEVIEQRCQISPSDYFKWQTEARLIRGPRINKGTKQAFEEAFFKNTDNTLATAYPDATKDQIDKCCGQIIALSSMTPESLDNAFKHFPSDTNEAKEEIKQKASSTQFLPLILPNSLL